MTTAIILIFLTKRKHNSEGLIIPEKGVKLTKFPGELFWLSIVLETIRQMGLELQVILDKGAVMVLPTGINKATGLAAALDEIQLSPQNTVGIGDAENDHDFLNFCGYSVAVANTLPTLKERVDFVTNNSREDGVIELIEKLITSDLA